MNEFLSHHHRRMAVEDSEAGFRPTLARNLPRLKLMPGKSLRSMRSISIPTILSEASMFKFLMATIVVIGAMFTASAALVQAQDGQAQPKREKPASFIIQDNEFRYFYSSWFRDPYITNPVTGKAQNISKNVIEFVHVDLGNKLGDNVFDMQYLSDNTTNPVSVPYFHDNTHDGSKDVYMTFRHDIVLDRIVNKDLSWGPIKNWVVSVGADFGSKNDDFSSQRRSPMVGPGVNFKIPNGGYWKVVAMWTREWNEEGTDVTAYDPMVPYKPTAWGKPVVYAQEASLQTGWGVPFALGSAPFIFEGFGVLNSAKGYGAGNLLYNNPQAPDPHYASGSYFMFFQGTRPELLLHGLLVYNFGSLVKKGGTHIWQIGVGYEYWHNIFGVPQFGVPINGLPGSALCNSCIANTPFATINIHM
jgi:nucleoside-specific outer membrane channel protein Tsx